MIFFRSLLLLGQNILAGARASFFMPIYLWSFKSSYFQVCLLLIVSLILTGGYDYFDTLPTNYFNPYGLSYQALLYLLFFFSLSLIVYLNKRLKDVLKLAVLLLSIVPAVWLGTLCLVYLSDKQTLLTPVQTNWAVFIVYLAWYLCIVLRLLKRFFYCSIIRAAGLVLLYGTINFTPLFLLPVVPLWYTAPVIDEELKGQEPVDIEKVYYSQHELLKHSASDVLNNNNDIVDLYFIGLAGDAEEDVFMNEAQSAKAILENKYNVFGRSLLLVNNLKTLEQYPLANQYNVNKALKEMAKKMDVDTDILLLFLSSHGTEEPSLSINFPELKLKNITPRLLNSGLQEAGIKWRIIIVSACFSGGFIEPLANPYTLVMTAARSDRNSFGCGHHGQYTYFGEAFFEDGLNQGYFFLEAFERAKKRVSIREEQEGFVHSEPQISLGLEMKAKLLEFENQQQDRKSLNWAYTEKN